MKHLMMVLCLLTTACAGGSLKPTDVNRSQSAKIQAVQQGTIIDIYAVTLKGNTETAQATGAVLGGYAANRAVRNENEATQVVVTVAGAAIGSMVGDTVSDIALDRPGINLIIQLDTGKTVSVTQESDARTSFTVGDSVYVINNGKTIRVLSKR